MLKKKSHGIQPVSMRMEFEDRTAKGQKVKNLSYVLERFCL